MKSVRTFVLIAVAATLAACSDNAIAPDPVVESSVAVEGSMADLGPTDTIRFSITIDPSKKTHFNLGSGNSLVFPAGSLCSINSSYGPAEWDNPCDRATSPLTINVKAWLNERGHAYVDFDKHVRFVPSLNPAQWVVLTFSDVEASLNPFFKILYCPTLGLPGDTGSCYDEAKLDPSLLTTRNPLNGKITRRIKHFSGYNVAAGREGEEESGDVLGVSNLMSSFSLSVSDLQLDTVDEVETAYPDLSRAEAEAMLARVREARRSGYILASG